MATKDIIAYLARGNQYYVGVGKGFSDGKYHFDEGCIIEKKDLPKEGNLEVGLKKAYQDAPNKRPLTLPRTDVMTPQSFKFTVEVE